jgi:hypothetical protein
LKEIKERKEKIVDKEERGKKQEKEENV